MSSLIKPEELLWHIKEGHSYNILAYWPCSFWRRSFQSAVFQRISIFLDQAIEWFNNH
jgi:hypothetical protein